MKAKAPVLVFVIVGIIFGLVLSSHLGIETLGHTSDLAQLAKRSGDAKDSKPPQPGKVSPQAVAELSRVSEAMVEVVSAVTPAVVNISTTQVAKGRRGDEFGGMLNDPFFRKFFGEEFSKQFGDQPRQRKGSSLGSGVIVREDGYILTNNHVVKDADEIKVTLSDNREFDGKLIGTDPKTDIAVIKIKASGLPTLAWGDSDKMRVGEMVIAVGSPYGLTQSVTTGIVSAKGRANVRIADYEDFIQTDAAINPGNSGGPLVNIHGELVGINTAIFSTSGGYQGIGFAIPTSMARSVMESLITDGKVVRGWLGVSIQGVNAELAKQFGLDSEKGALVSDVVEDSPAEKAGLKRGDIVLEYQGKKVDDPGTLRNIVAATAPDTKVEILISREGKQKTIGVTVGHLPEDGSVTGKYSNALKGVQVQELTPEIRANLKIPKRVKGVIVTDVEEQQKGLRRGDVILEVNRATVDTLEAYDEAASKIDPDSDVLVLIYRDGGVYYLTLKAGQK